MLVEQPADQLRPFNAGADLDNAPLLIERDHLVHRPHVQQYGVRPELLATHGMPAAHDADRLAGCGGVLQRRLDGLDRVGPQHLPNPRGVELRMDVVYDDPTCDCHRRPIPYRHRGGAAS